MYTLTQPQIRSTKHRPMVTFKLVAAIFLLTLHSIFGQTKNIDRPFGLQLGIIDGILGEGSGPSISFHYAFNQQKAIQPEFAIAYESQSGKTFLSGYNSRASAVSLTIGPRFNFSPQKNWNPSILINGGLMIGGKDTDKAGDIGTSGVSGAINIGFSNMIMQSHMLTVGVSGGMYLGGLYLKYGYWLGRKNTSTPTN